MAVFFGQTVDMLEQFSDSTLETGIVETDAGGVLTVASANQYVSSPSASELAPGTTATAFYRLATGTGFPSVSGGFWYRSPTNISTNAQTYVHALTNQASTVFLTVRDEVTSGAVRQLRFTVGATVDQLTITGDTWYWITSKATNAGDCLINVYAADHTLLKEIVISGQVPASDMNRYQIGRHATISATVTGSQFFDDWVLDKTSAQFPLLAWEATVPLQGAIAGTSTITGSLNPDSTLAGSINGQSTISGSLQVQKTLGGSIAGASSVSGKVNGTAYIIDHTHVDLYTSIPQAYIDIIKDKWINVPGESHSLGYRNGLQFVEDIEAKFSVTITEVGDPLDATSTGSLRCDKANWGDYDSPTGWLRSLGEEDWYTNAAGIARVKAHIKYCHDNNFGGTYLGFGWCWDMTWVNAATATKDPVYKCGWAGSSGAGPEGNLAWGLDAEDFAITGNTVCLDTYLAATKQYVDYCESTGYDTKMFFTTGPVDGYSGERAYGRYLKQERIRDYVRNNGGWLFDYGDILRYNNAGTSRNDLWADADTNTHFFEMIADDNMLDFDGSYVEDGDHIGQRGALRLGKAQWVMMAMMEGWDGSSGAVLSGQMDATSTASGSLSVSKLLSGQIAGESSVFGTLNSAIELSGVILGASTVSGSISVSKLLSGTKSAISTITGRLNGALILPKMVNIAFISKCESITFTAKRVNIAFGGGQ